MWKETLKVFSKFSKKKMLRSKYTSLVTEALQRYFSFKEEIEEANSLVSEN
jgi:hypothetical protein